MDLISSCNLETIIVDTGDEISIAPPTMRNAWASLAVAAFGTFVLVFGNKGLPTYLGGGLFSGLGFVFFLVSFFPKKLVLKPAGKNYLLKSRFLGRSTRTGSLGDFKRLEIEPWEHRRLGQNTNTSWWLFLTWREWRDDDDFAVGHYKDKSDCEQAAQSLSKRLGVPVRERKPILFESG